MAKSTFVSLLAASAVLFNGASATLPSIVIKGSKFFYSNNGTQFFIKGVAYQSGIASAASGGGSISGNNATGYTDPLADTASCKRDIPYLQQLGANTIRTYAIDPTADHSACMAALDAAGIYVISDLGQPNLSINREDPQWTTELYARYTGVVDSLSSYSNVIGFFAGNEVSNNVSYTGASAFVKASVRDTKAYIKAKGYHGMGVGYAADDDATIRAYVSQYFNCGPVEDQIDFWGYNIYEWCGNSNYELSGYSERTKEFTGYSVPAFFAEYGCNTQGGGAAGRKFTEVAALYGSNMSSVFSGGFVYEYFQEENDYGLVSVSGNSVSTLADFAAWSTQIHAVSPTAVNSASYTPTNTVGQSCPTADATWAVNTALPPTPNQSVCSCMMASLTCKVAANVNTSNVGTLFNQVCGYNGGKPCSAIVRNTTTGVYGAYSMCNATEQLSNAFNAYYLSQNSASTACDFAGAAQVVKAAGAASSCSALIASATSANSGGAANTGGAASSSTKKSDASGLVGPTFGAYKYAIGFTVLAITTGAGMVLL